VGFVNQKRGYFMGSIHGFGGNSNLFSPSKIQQIKQAQKNLNEGAFGNYKPIQAAPPDQPVFGRVHRPTWAQYQPRD
jgi:hypothetical protein